MRSSLISADAPRRFLTLLRALEVNIDLRHVNHIRYYYYYSVVRALSHVMYIVAQRWQYIGDIERGEGFQAHLRKALSLPHHKAPS